VTLDDRLVQCRECGDSFVFSAGEQELLAVRGASGAPALCPRCRRPSTLAKSQEEFGPGA